MPRAPHPLPDELGHVFTTAAATGAGVSVKRLRAQDLEIPFRGVRRRRHEDAVVSAPPGARNAGWPDAGHVGAERIDPLAREHAERRRVLADATAYAHLMGPGAFFCGRTAAVLHGAGIEPGADLDVAVFAPSRAPRRAGIRGRKVEPDLADVVTVDGLRVSTPASTWAMLGGALDVRDLVRLGDAIVRVPRDHLGRARPEAQLASPEQLRAALLAGRRIGASRLAAALRRIRVGAMSPLETDFRLVVVDAGLPEPDLDVPVLATDGRLLGIADAAYPRWGVLVEVEGDHHRTDRRQWNRDIEKHAAFVAAGWYVVRLTSAHIRGAHPRAATLVRAALVTRGWHPIAP